MTTKQIAIYRPGQGIDSRFTSIFATGTSDCTQLVGIGSEDNGFFFGYNGTSFGVLRRSGGKREIRQLTLTAAASNSGNVTITLNGSATACAVTNVGTISENAKEIAAVDFSVSGNGWEVYSHGNIVTFVAYTAETRSGSYSFVDTDTTNITATGPTAILTGTAPTDDWIASTAWNIDQADGSGHLPTLTYTNGNVYQIKYQWLGFGMITYSVENPVSGEFQPVHKIRYANTATDTSVINPKQPMMAQIKKSSGASSLTLQVPSMATFLSGINDNKYNPHHSLTQSSNFSSINQLNMLSLNNKRVFNSVYSTVTLGIEYINIYNGHSKGAEFQVTINTVLKGDITWTDIESDHSLAEYNASNVELTSDGNLEYTTVVEPGGSRLINSLDITLIPGDTITISAAHLGGGSAGDMSASIGFTENF